MSKATQVPAVVRSTLKALSALADRVPELQLLPLATILVAYKVRELQPAVVLDHCGNQYLVSTYQVDVWTEGGRFRARHVEEQNGCIKVRPLLRLEAIPTRSWSASWKLRQRDIQRRLSADVWKRAL